MGKVTLISAFILVFALVFVSASFGFDKTQQTTRLVTISAGAGDITAVFPYSNSFLTINNTDAADVYIIFDSSLLNDTINAFLGNGTFGAGSGDITAVNPFDLSIILNNTATGDVYPQVNMTFVNGTINAFLGNGTFGAGSGDITAVNPFDISIIINNSATGDVYVQTNESRINDTINAFLGNGTFGAAGGTVVWADVINGTTLLSAQNGTLNVNSSDFLDTAQGTISGVNSSEFNVTTGTLTIYVQWLLDFITDNSIGTAVESIRSANTFISFNASTADVEATFNDTRLNRTINAFLGNGTFGGGAGDITAVNPFDISIIINNSASGDVYVQTNESRINDTINSFLGNGTFTGFLTTAVESIRSADTYVAYNDSNQDVESSFNETRLNRTINSFLGNGTFGGGSGDITAVNPFDISIIINNSASGDVYVQTNESRINDTINAFLGNTTYTYGVGTNSNLTISSNNFVVDVASLVTYLNSLYHTIANVVESFRSVSTYLVVNASNEDIEITLNETRLNRTINAFLGNGTFGSGSGDITAVNPFDISIIINNSATGDVYVQTNESRINDTINAFLGNGTFISTPNSSLMRNDGDTATGNYTFDTTTFFIDSTNNNVGFNTTTPRGSAVTIKGDLNITAKTGESGLIFHNGTGICIGACA